MVIKTLTRILTGVSRTAGKHAVYQQSFRGHRKGGSFYETWEVTEKNVKNDIVYYKEKVECRHPIFWPGSQRSTAILQIRSRIGW
jgi:predicted AlkP superfamily phosphohydrolase/phosphomutase